jgi:hypothetical protein
MSGRPLDPRLYEPEQVLAAEGKLPLDHPGWFDEHWSRTPQNTTAIASGSPQTAERCPRHGDMCAYRGDEPGRCRVCHRSWDVITGRDERIDAMHAKPRRAARAPEVVRAEHEGSHR